MLAIEGLGLAKEVRRREPDAADERRQRHVSRDHQHHAEHDRGDGAGGRIERQDHAQARRDSLAAPKLQIDRKRMTEDRGQPDQDRQVHRDRAESRRTSQGKPSVGSSPLSRSRARTRKK